LAANAGNVERSTKASLSPAFGLRQMLCQHPTVRRPRQVNVYRQDFAEDLESVTHGRFGVIRIAGYVVGNILTAAILKDPVFSIPFPNCEREAGRARGMSRYRVRLYSQ